MIAGFGSGNYKHWIVTMMMCNDLMCTFKLFKSHLSLAHSAKVKTDMPEIKKKLKNSCSPWSQFLDGKVKEL